MGSWHKPLLANLHLTHFFHNCRRQNVHQLHEYKRIWTIQWEMWLYETNTMALRYILYACLLHIVNHI
jgi:hypothetical protein